MAGTQCGDFDAKALGNNLCLLTTGPYAGLVAFPDGRVPSPTADSSDGSGGELTFTGPEGNGAIKQEGLSAESVRVTLGMAGAEIGNCEKQGPMSTHRYATLLPVYQNRGVAWLLGDLKHIQHVLGQSRPEASHTAFFCSNINQAGWLGFNIDEPGHVQTAIDNLEESCGPLDALHCDAVIDGMRHAIGLPSRETKWDDVKKHAGYAVSGVVVFAVGGLVSHILSKWWDNRGGGGGSGGATGGGKATDATAPAARQTPQATTPPATSESSERRNYIVEAVGDGDGAGVRVIQGDFDPLPPEPTRPFAPTRTHPDTSHEIRPFPYLFGALAVGALILATDGAAAPEAEAVFELAVAAF